MGPALQLLGKSEWFRKRICTSHNVFLFFLLLLMILNGQHVMEDSISISKCFGNIKAAESPYILPACYEDYYWKYPSIYLLLLQLFLGYRNKIKPINAPLPWNEMHSRWYACVFCKSILILPVCYWWPKLPMADWRSEALIWHRGIKLQLLAKIIAAPTYRVA